MSPIPPYTPDSGGDAAQFKPFFERRVFGVLDDNGSSIYYNGIPSAEAVSGVSHSLLNDGDATLTFTYTNTSTENALGIAVMVELPSFELNRDGDGVSMPWGRSSILRNLQSTEIVHNEDQRDATYQPGVTGMAVWVPAVNMLHYGYMEPGASISFEVSDEISIISPDSDVTIWPVSYNGLHVLALGMENLP